MPSTSSPSSAAEPTVLERLLCAPDGVWGGLIESIAEYVTIIDTDGTVRFTNRPPPGQRPGDILGRNVVDLTLPEFRENLRTRLEHVVRTGEASEEYERGVPETDGRSSWYRVRLSPITWQREVVGVVLAATDVTQQRHAEGALRESEQRLRAIVEAEPECVKLLDREGRLLSMNPAGLAMVEAASLDEVKGRDILSLIAPEYRDAFAGLNRLVLEGETGTLEFDIIGLQGTRRSMETHAAPMRDADGRVSGVLAVTRDVTERRRAETAFWASEERLRLVALATQDVVWDWNLNTNRFWVAEQKRALFGAAPQPGELDIEVWVERIHPDDRDRVTRSLELAFHAPERPPHWSQEYRFRMDNGLYRYFLDRGYILRDDSGRAVRMVGAMMDITSPKRAEDELARSRAALRELAAHLESVREAERTRIARELHDELGQALTALKLDLAWLKPHVPPGRSRAARKLKDMAALIDATAERVHQLAVELRPGVLDALGLPAAVRWVGAEFSRRAGVRCATHVAFESLDVDPALASALFRILQEALTNVARHSGATEVEVRLTAGGGTVALTVQDNGRGITDAEAASPTGLGLLGMRERAASWGGRAQVTGTPGAGTLVRVELPAIR